MIDEKQLLELYAKVNKNFWVGFKNVLFTDNFQFKFEKMKEVFTRFYTRKITSKDDESEHSDFIKHEVKEYYYKMEDKKLDDPINQLKTADKYAEEKNAKLNEIANKNDTFNMIVFILQASQVTTSLPKREGHLIISPSTEAAAYYKESEKKEIIDYIDENIGKFKQAANS